MKLGELKTELLYLSDAHLYEFDANILKIIDIDEENAYFILNRTAFFPQGGGQPADHGLIISTEGKAKVVDVQEKEGDVYHKVKILEGTFKENDAIRGKIDATRRLKFMRAHSGSHLLFGAIKAVLGHIEYAGFEISEDKIRMDIQYPGKVTKEVLDKAEILANKVMIEDRPMKTYTITTKEAIEKFGEELSFAKELPDEILRIVEIPEWDIAACSGTHCLSSGMVRMIKIIGSYRLQENVERVEFLVGEQAILNALRSLKELDNISKQLQVEKGNIIREIGRIKKELETLQKENIKLRKEMAGYKLQDLVEKEQEQVGDYKLVVGEVPMLSTKEIVVFVKETCLKDRNLILVIGSYEKNAYIVGGLGEDVKGAVNISEIIHEAAQELGGRGGGGPTLAQGGGPMKVKLKDALSLAKSKIKQKILGK